VPRLGRRRDCWGGQGIFPWRAAGGVGAGGVRRLIANKIEVAVASGAGQAVWFSDDDYVRAERGSTLSRKALG